MARYWLPHKEHVWVPGTLVSVNSDKASFTVDLDDDGEVVQLPAKDMAGFATVDPEQETGVEDVCQLSNVTEGILLHTTRVRYGKKLIYTRVSRTLIAVNPFDDLPIYSSQYVEQYKALTDSMDAPPHIFGVSQDALKGLQATDRDQAILISGESGAGKTESAKLILSFVADAVRGSEGGIEERVLQTNPVLEAFGNAMTVRNNNSSRFGKWLDLRCSGSSGVALAVMGCSLTSYLLETMRVCSQASDERGFHVFYQLLQVKSSPVLSHLGLETPRNYNYLKDAQLHAPGIDDAEGFVELREAFFMLGIDEKMQGEIFRVLAGILVLGNCDFAQDGHDASRLADEAPARKVADHLQVSPEKVIRCLLFRQIAIGRDITETAMRVDQARASRDGLARLLYGRLFLWLLSRLNKTLTLDDCPPAGEERLMGILDIAGFESFNINSLEQLMINLSNEHLQQYFNKVIFKEELDESAKEGISMEGKIEFADNADCLSLVDGKAGLLDLLDETMVVPKATDQMYVTKVLKQHDKHARIIAPKFAKLGFGIRHFAGNVNYTCEGWLEKNADRPPDESAQLLVTSELEILQEIGETMADERAAMEGGGAPPASRGPGPSMTPGRGPAGRGKKTRSVTAGFRTSLRSLLTKISAADPHYIRCVKPNTQKVPGRFTSAMVMEQMLLSGVLATVHIRQQGFAYRILHKQFLMSYRCIVDADPETKRRLPKSDVSKQGAQDLVDALVKHLPSVGQKAFAVGKTKVFVKQEAFKDLEDQRRRVLGSMSVFIQRVWRGKMARDAIGEIQELRADLRELLSRLEMPQDRTCTWTGESVLEQLGSLEVLQRTLAELAGLIGKSDGLGFRNGDTVDAELAKRRMLLEVDAVVELEKLHTSIDPVAMEKAMARARSVKLLSTKAAMELEIRLVRVRAQLPLMKAMEAAIAESANKGEDDLREILDGAEELGLQKGSDKWLPELDGLKLLGEVESILEAKVAARKEQERLEAERLAAEKAAEEARRLEAERLAAEAAKKAAEEEAKQRALEAEEAAKAEAARLEAAKAEAAKAEAAALEAAKADAERIEAARTEAAKAEEMAAEAARAEAQASAAVKTEAVKCEAAKAEAVKAEEAKLACQHEPEVAFVDENGEVNGLLRRPDRKRKTTRKRTCVTGLAEADCSQTLSALSRAADEYDAEALEVLLRRVAENGIKDEDGSSRGLETARGVFERLQDQEFVLESLSEVKEAADDPDPPIGVLKRLENLARQLRRMPGYEAEADEANKILQGALVGRSEAHGQNSLFASRDAQDLELAKRIYGNLSSYSRLKPEKEWGSHSGAGASLARKHSLAFGKVRTMAPEENQMLLHSHTCINESLTRVPEGFDSEEYEGSAVMNFRNVLVCMGDRPAQGCQRNASRAAILYLALSDALVREEVYVQVLKQLNGNKSERGVQLGFELLLRLCQKAPASSELAEFLRAFLREKIPDLSGTDAQGVAKACLMRLDDPDARDEDQQASRSRFHSSAADEPRSRAFSTSLDEQMKIRRRSSVRLDEQKRRGSRRLSLDNLQPAKQEDPELDYLTTMATQVSQRLDGAAARLNAEVSRLANEGAGSAESERLAAEVERLKAEKAQEAVMIAALASRAMQAAGQLDMAAGHVTGEVAQLSARASNAAVRLDQAAGQLNAEVGGLSTRATGVAERLDQVVGQLTAQVGGASARAAAVAERMEVAAARLEGEVSRLKAENREQAAEIERLKALLAQQSSS